MNGSIIVLGAGMAGLAAGMSGLSVYEAEERPGGISSSYYLHSISAERLFKTPPHRDAYRFEIGGGHWIFGGDPAVHRLIRCLTSVHSYSRKSAIWFPHLARLVPYPLQNHLSFLGPDLAARSLREIIDASASRQKISTMAEWLRLSFGETLFRLFFQPFHELYAAGLSEKIVPQDAHKSPLDLDLIVQGALSSSPPVGYNTTFVYPSEGLDDLARAMAASCDTRLGKRIVRIVCEEKEIHFADGSTAGYGALLSTLPLHHVLEMADLKTAAPPDPYSSVLVLNIGAVKERACPQEHWVYVPVNRGGFHRVGFYSNVDVSFLPQSARSSGDRVSLYVEKAFPAGYKPGGAEISRYAREVTNQLQAWGWIGEVDVLDPTWVEVAYTWSWVGSNWKQEALSLLEKHDIYQIGRYGRWRFQGIADSIRDGLLAGAAMAGSGRCQRACATADRDAWVEECLPTAAMHGETTMAHNVGDRP